MAIHQSLDQKRLEALRMQLNGKSEEKNKKTLSPKNNTYQYSPTSTSTTIKTDEQYLKKDLLKITLISAFLITAQFIIYWSLQTNKIHLGF